VHDVAHFKTLVSLFNVGNYIGKLGGFASLDVPSIPDADFKAL
jgi:hypothetical protein